MHSLTVKPWDVERLHSVLKNYEYDDILEKYLENKHILRKELIKGENNG